MRITAILYTLTLSCLVLSCSKEEDEELPLTACFEVDHEKSGEIGHVFAFTNCSENADRYEWDFGDGVPSIFTSPTHQFADFGDYTVRLTAFRGSESKTFEIDMKYGYYKVKELFVTNVELGNYKDYGDECEDAGIRLAVKARDLSMSQDRIVCGKNYTIDSDDNCVDIGSDYIVPANTEILINSKVSCWDGVLGGNVENHIVSYAGDKSIDLYESMEYEDLLFRNDELGYQLNVTARFEIETAKFW